MLINRNSERSSDEVVTARLEQAQCWWQCKLIFTKGKLSHIHSVFYSELHGWYVFYARIH